MTEPYFKRLRPFEKTLPNDEGEYCCKVCGVPLHRKNGAYCGEVCQNIYEIPRNWNVARWHVSQRDKGVCARCGVDTSLIVRQIRRYSFRYRDGGVYFDAARMRSIRDEYEEWAEPLRQKGFALPNISVQPHEPVCLAEVDHILPVWKGGGGCGLDNLQTLCVPCHRQVTKEQSKERAEWKKRGTT
jgi:5-methylcytosine-specific restriction endonuclease McrA